VLKVRVIPTLLWKSFGLVKGVRFDSWRRVGSVLPAIKVYNARDVDELILVDITASSERRSPDHESVSEFADECAVPLTVGGGIRRHDEIVRLLHAGADKVSLNSTLYEEPDLVDAAARQFGSQCVDEPVGIARHRPRAGGVGARAGNSRRRRDPADVGRS
jgi:imidazole glycerol-phosphate synthase subunit HisF